VGEEDSCIVLAVPQALPLPDFCGWCIPR